jgi:hypothetical protein
MFGVSRVGSLAYNYRRVTRTLTAGGNAQVDTAQSKFGGASALFDGTGDNIKSDSGHADFGTGDFTVEGFVRFNSTTGTQVFYDKRPAGGTGSVLLYWVSGTGFIYYGNGNNRITGGTASTGVWYHWAVSRINGSTKMFIDGTQVGSTYTDANNYASTAAYVLGESVDTGAGWNGWMDEIRVSNVGRYSGNFTPSSVAFTNDRYTLLLMHCNGTDASTTFTDDNA